VKEPRHSLAALLATAGRAGARLRARRSATVLAASVAAVLPLAACSDDDEAVVGAEPTATTATTEAPAPGAEPAVIEVTVPGGPDGEFRFQTDLTTIEAGPVELRLQNDGALEHQAAIFRFDDGQDLGTFAAAAASEGPQAALALVDGYGGPNAVAPGATGSSTQVLVPGAYALLCVIPDANGVPHAAQGMLHAFTVSEPSSPPAAVELAEPDVEVDLVDLAFLTDTELDAGATVRATNRGEQVHEIVTYRLEDGQTVEDVVAATASGGEPPPLGPAGGLVLLAPGRSADFRLPEEPGDYVFLCFVPDAASPDGAAHLTRGMATQVTIE